MLTKSDLSKIGQVVTQTFKPVKQDIGTIKQDVSGLKKDVGVLKTDVAGLKKDMTGVKKDVSVLKKNTKKIKTTLDDFVDYFDKSYLDHEKRINYIENHLQLTHPLGI